MATMIYARVGLAACGLAFIGRTLLRQRVRARAKANEAVPNLVARQQPPASRRQRPAASVPEVRQATGGGEQLSALEKRLRTAILSADAGERLVKQAQQRTGGDRAAAIRRVLSDLEAENNRWS